jgi:TorA maturation chaperone TorD
LTLARAGQYLSKLNYYKKKTPMRNAGLGGAIRIARGVDAPARFIGIPQSSESDTSRIPAARSVETVSGMDGTIPPSDLDTERPGMAADVDEIDAARAQEYALLSVLLARAPDAALLARLAQLRGDASPLGLAHAALAEAASRADVERVEREYFDLFIGLGRGELLPYGSYYLSGFLHERPLARLRAHLSRLGIERSAEQTEPEDHAAILCEIMAGLASGRFPAPAGADRELFEQHLAPWIGRFFADLEQAQAADFYRRIGTLGRVFIVIETEAFVLPS